MANPKTLKPSAAAPAKKKIPAAQKKTPAKKPAPRKASTAKRDVTIVKKSNGDTVITIPA